MNDTCQDEKKMDDSECCGSGNCCQENEGEKKECCQTEGDTCSHEEPAAQ